MCNHGDRDPSENTKNAVNVRACSRVKVRHKNIKGVRVNRSSGISVRHVATEHTFSDVHAEVTGLSLSHF